MSISILARCAWVALLALALCPPPALAARLDQTTIGNGVVSIDFTGTDAGQGGTNLRLTSMGRWRDARDVDRYTIWRLRNSGTTPRTVRLDGYQTPFAVSLTLRPRSDTLLRSPIIGGPATHRLYEGSALVDTKAAGNTQWTSTVEIVPAAGTNRPPIFLSAPEGVTRVGQVYRYPPLVEDPDGDLVNLGTQLAPAGYTYEGASGAFRFVPLATQAGAHDVGLRADDGRGGTATQAYVLRVLADFCPIFPIAIPKTRLDPVSVGQNVNNVLGGGGANQFAWLSWSGAPGSALLATSLIAPGDSETYVNPDDALDRRIDLFDWTRGITGISDSPELRSRLTALLQRELVVPEWYESRSRSAGTDYHVVRFLRMRLTAFDLAGAGKLSFTYLGDRDCYELPPLANDQSLSTRRDTALDLVLSGSDPDGDALSFVVTLDPAHGTLSGTAPNLRYTPAPGYEGRDRVLFKTVANSVASEPGEVLIDVLPPGGNNQPPLALPMQFYTGNCTLESYAFDASDPDGDDLSFRIVEAPQHGVATVDGSGFTYQMNPGTNYYTSPDRFRYLANDGQVDSAPAIVDISIVGGDCVPTAHSQSLITLEDQPLPIVLTATDPNNDGMRFDLQSQPAHGSLSGTSPDLIYTPEANYHGPDGFTFLANDGYGNSNVAMIEIDVRSVDDPPVAIPQSLSVGEEQSLPIVLSGIDAEGAALGFRVTATPAHGNVTGTAPNLVYMPFPNYHGTDTLRFVANDGGMDSVEAVIAITILPAHDAPIAIAQSLTVAEDESLALVLSGSDPDGDALEFALQSMPQHGSLSGTEPNLIYTPDADYHGPDAFTFTVADAQSTSAPATVSLTVTPVNDPPRFSSAPPLVAPIAAAYAYDAQAIDVDGDTLAFALLTAPPGMVIESASGLVAWTPTVAQVGDHAVSIEVSDGNGGRDVQSYVVHVPAPNGPPQIISPPIVSVPESAAYAYDVDAIDTDVADVLAYSLDVAPVVSSINPATGLVSWAPLSTLVSGVRTPNRMCRRPSSEIGTFQPRVKWQWNEFAVLSQPVVAPLTDTDGDGRVTAADDPVVLFVRWYSDCARTTVHALDGKTGSELWRFGGLGGVGSGSHVAVADLEGDGQPEVVAMLADGGVVALTNSGQVKWTSTEPRLTSCYVQGAPTIADLEGDGQAEILARGAVLNSNGSLRFLHPDLWHGTIDTAVDLDGDGIQEVLSLDRAFRADGTVMWQLPDGDKARSMIPVNVDSDPQPEIAYVGAHVGLVDHLGRRIWRFSNTTSYNATPLSAGDLDGDGRTDLVALLNGQLRAFRANDGSTLWAALVDEPSHLTGAAIFDFEGDGRYEVIYADTFRLRVYDGATGTVRLDVENPSATATESPSVADVDNDGHADLIITSDRGQTTGIRVIEDLYGSWRRTRPIWNQFQYSIDSIDDALRPPAPPREGWRVHNTFRANEMLDTPAPELPDLAVFDVRLVEDGANNRISAQVLNRGLRASLQATTARLYNGSPQDGGALLGEVAVDPVPVGGAFMVNFAPVAASAVDRNLWVEVDPENSLPECIDSNNHSIGVLFDTRVSDSTGLHDTQRWTTSVEDVNAPPSIATTALPVALPGQTFRATIAIDDPDLGDAHEFSIIEAPSGVSINPVSGQLLWYVPLAALGTHTVVVRAIDLAGAEASRSYTLTVDGNNAPRFISAPTVQAVVGDYYTYVARATDLENDAITYELASGPTGMQSIGLSGSLYWTPTQAQVGQHAVVLRARDARGATSLQSFSIRVLATAANRPPTVVSSPGTSAVVGAPYTYVVEGSDPDGDTLRYQLMLAPAGMSIDASSGRITWTPAQAGSNPVRVRVHDIWGAQALQDFTLVAAVSTNRQPQITSTPAPSAKVGREYRYDVDAIDADGDTLAYSLPTAPAGMVIDPASGLVRWTPQAAGAVTPSVRAADAQGYAQQQWSLDVVPANVALDVAVQVSPRVVDPGDTLGVTIATTGAAGPVAATLTVGGQSQSVTPNGTTTITAPTTFGCTTIAVTVADGYETATAEDAFCVDDPNDAQPPLVALLSPADETEVTAPVAVRGSVSDLRLASWTLAHRPSNSPEAVPTVIAQGTESLTDQVLGTFDPTLLHNGQYALILQATDAGGRTTSDSVVVRVTGDMKVGHFAITFEDASIPVAGIPVRVTRTYDTRQRGESLDFGYGWSVDYQNVRIHESAKLGFSWRIEARNGGFFPLQCAVSNGNRVVTVTLPDGEVETFHARAEPECGEAFTPQTRVQMVFVPVDNTDSRLEQTTYGLLGLNTVAGSGVYNLVDLEDPSTPVDPKGYRLTTAEGLVYELDQSFGVRRIIEPNGQSLTYSATGVVHSSGIGIQFVRDAQGRIQDMVLPDGQVLSYTYTAAGDLESYTDAIDQSTTFAYGLAQFPHYLTDITDPRGVRVIRNEYDEDGRLVATIDADGHRIEYDHDIDGRTEQVRDRRGNLQTFVYDDNGWVLAETNALGETTRHTYDTNGNELTRTDPLGHVTTWTYDLRGNALSETNPLGQATTSTYDGRNSLLSQTDPLGRTVITNTYHPRTGALLATADALGHGTSFSYDSGVGSDNNTGELLGMTDALGQATMYELHQAGLGWRVADVDPLGHRTTYTHDSVGRVVTETRTRTVPAVGGGTSTQSLVTRSTYDAKGRVIRTDLPDGSHATIDFNAIDKPVRECDALARCTVTTYDARGNVTRVEQPDGSSDSTTYDANGNVTAQTDRAGRTTRMVYDAANRLVETLYPDDTPGTDADNPRTTQAYDAAGRLTATTDELGQFTSYQYDAANRRTSVVAPPVGAASAATLTSYDAAGRRTSETDPNGNTTSFVYDATGRLTETPYADGNRARMEYDALGRKTAEIDPAGRRTEYAYDALGRLTTVTLAAGTPSATVTRYAYDEAGNRTTQTDAESRSTRWTFDPAGRELSRTLPLGQTESSAYDVLGNRLTHNDFRGRTTGYAHDLLNRPTGVDYPTDPDVGTTYAPSGQRASTTDVRGTTGYAYDARDRLVRKSDPDGLTIEYTYDAAGNLVSRVSPSQSLVYTYDARNRLETVTRTIDGAPPQVTRYAYDAAGNRSEMVGADGTRTTYAYDTRHRLATLTKRTAAAALLVGMSYTVDATGLRTGFTESDPIGTTRTVAYAYDALKRLTAEAITHRDPTRNRTSTWTYDRVGNRLTQSVQTGAGTAGAASAATIYTYDANDRLLTESTTLDANPATVTAYTYDANGNTLQKATVTGPIDYTYDDANRLVEMRQSGDRTTYAYDADGLRVGQTRHPATGDAITTRYLQDPSYAYSQVVEQWRKVGASPTTLEASYAFADELIAQTRYQGATATTRFVQADGLGSVRWLTDSTGATTDAIDYDAFGNEIAREGTSETEHLYRGEQFDPGLGFYYLRARWMDPASGRFTQQDAFGGFNGDPRSLHKYLYANASPANGIDPSGHMTLPELGAALQSITINLSARVVLWSWRHQWLSSIGSSVAASILLPAELQVPTPMSFAPMAWGATQRTIKESGRHLSETMRLFLDRRTSAGPEFESLVEALLRISKNRRPYSVDLPWRRGAKFYPDFLWKGGFMELKAVRSLGSHDLEQAEKLAAYAAQKGVPLTYLFLRRPSPEEIRKLEAAFAEGTGGAEISYSLNYIFD